MYFMSSSFISIIFISSRSFDFSSRSFTTLSWRYLTSTKWNLLKFLSQHSQPPTSTQKSHHPPATHSDSNQFSPIGLVPMPKEMRSLVALPLTSVAQVFLSLCLLQKTVVSLSWTIIMIKIINDSKSNKDPIRCCEPFHSLDSLNLHRWARIMEWTVNIHSEWLVVCVLDPSLTHSCG